MSNSNSLGNWKGRPLTKQDRRDLNVVFDQMRAMQHGSTLFDDGWLFGWLGKEPCNGEMQKVEWRLGWRVGKFQRKRFDELTDRRKQ